ncbi:MAG: O-antigen ligase family protein [Verrucomicrobia bacterium]|nr:O-antigen ligase family protein [Verrucomicrobiota bacterium]
MQFAGTISTGAGYSESRRKRRLIISISTRRSVYEWTAISFLLALPLIGMGILGAVRLWISGPLLVLCFLGVALFFLRPLLTGDRQTLKIPPGGIAWVVFLLYGLALIPLSRVPYDARIEMLYVASYVGAYWAWTELTSCYRRWRIILSLVIVAVTVIAWYAIIQNANESRMVLGWERPEAYGMRASGTFFCPNHFAHLLSVSICICVALAMMAASGAALRLLAIYGIALCISALFLTQSRSGWIGAVVGVGVTVSMAMWRKSQKWFLATILGGPIVLLLVSAALWMGSDVFRDRLITAMPGASGSTAAIRLNIWHDTLPMIQDAPVLGHGPGSYRWVYPAYRSFSAQLWARYAHNEYLHMLSEFGIVGFLLAAVAVAAFAMKLLSVFRKASRDRDALMIAGLMGAVAASLTHALFDYNLHIPSTMHLLVMFAGITVGGIFSSEDLPVVQLKRNASNVLWVVGTAAALAFAFLSAHAYIVDNLVQRGETRRKTFSFKKRKSTSRPPGI